MPKVFGQPAIYWIDSRAAEHFPEGFQEAVRALGDDVWGYLEKDLTSRDNFLDRKWQKIYPRIPKGVFEPPKPAGARIQEALHLLSHMGSVPTQIQPALVSIIEEKSHSPLLRIHAVRILGEQVDELSAPTIASINDCFQICSDPDLKLALYCSMIKNGIESNFSERDLVGLVPKISSSSVHFVQWLICYSDLNVVSFWKELLKRNDNVSTQLFSPRQLSLILDSNRKLQLLTAALDVSENFSSSSQNQILNAVSSYWDLYDRKIIDLKIIPALLKALENPDQTLQLTAARGLLNFDAPPDLILPALIKARWYSLRPQNFDPFIKIVEERK